MEVSTDLALNFTKSKECFINLATKAPCEDAEQFAEIFLYCCAARHSIQSGGKQNSGLILQLMNHGEGLDKLLLDVPNEFYQLVDQERPDVHKTLTVHLWFDLLDMEKFKSSFKPLMLWRENLWEESVVLLQRYLIRRHRGDDEFFVKLRKAIELTSQSLQDKQFWRPSMPLRIAYNSAKQNVVGMFRVHFKEAGMSDEEIDMRLAEAQFEEELASAETSAEIIAAGNRALEKAGPRDDD